MTAGLLHQLAFKALLQGDALLVEKEIVQAELRDSDTIDSRVSMCFYRQVMSAHVVNVCCEL
jgi:hypothetical protein